MSANEKHLVLISRRKSDHDFFTEIAARFGMKLTAPSSAEDLLAAALTGAHLIIDADDEEFHTPKFAFSSLGIIQLFKDRVDPINIFALSNEYVYQDPRLTPPESEFTKKIRHNILRKFIRPEAVEIYGRVLDVSFKQQTPSLTDYFPANQKVHKITLTNSIQRRLAVEALQKVVEEIALSGRLASKLAQGADEILMNAIFDAPRDSINRACRKEVQRDLNFELKDKDAVNFEMMCDGNFLGVSVTDFYGSLIYKDILRSLSVDYVKTKYNVKGDTLGAGLGLYQTTYNGISTVYSVLPGEFTRVIIFFPAVKSNLEFKDSFEFMSSYFMP